MEVKALTAHVRRRYRLTPLPDRPVAQLASIIECLPEGIRVRVEPPGGAGAAGAGAPRSRPFATEENE